MTSRRLVPCLPMGVTVALHAWRRSAPERGNPCPETNVAAQTQRGARSTRNARHARLATLAQCTDLSLRIHARACSQTVDLTNFPCRAKVDGGPKCRRARRAIGRSGEVKWCGSSCSKPIALLSVPAHHPLIPRAPCCAHRVPSAPPGPPLMGDGDEKPALCGACSTTAREC